MLLLAHAEVVQVHAAASLVHPVLHRHLSGPVDCGARDVSVAEGRIARQRPPVESLGLANAALRVKIILVSAELLVVALSVS